MPKVDGLCDEMDEIHKLVHDNIVKANEKYKIKLKNNNFCCCQIMKKRSENA